MIEPGQIVKLMLIFGVGYLAVFSVFVLLYLRAYRKREQLNLTRRELLSTVSSVQEYIHCGIAIVSIASVLLGGPRTASVAGLIYTMTGVVMAVHGKVRKRDVWRTRWRPPSLSQLNARQTQLE